MNKFQLTILLIVFLSSILFYMNVYKSENTQEIVQTKSLNEIDNSVFKKG